MIPLQSQIEGQELALTDAADELKAAGYTLGGNWDYDHGCFDKSLDKDNKVWLRIPFEVTVGRLDAELSAQDTLIRFGSPYVLKHVYEEGVDRHAGLASGLLNQFQDPVNADADVEPSWVDKARTALSAAEKRLLKEAAAT